MGRSPERTCAGRRLRGGRRLGAAPSGRHLRAAPLARRVAREAGVDLAGIPGTGPRGAVVSRDVPKPAGPPTPAAEKPPAPRAAPVDRTASIRRAVGQLMARSKREIPHYYLSADVDFSVAQAWLAGVNAGRPPQRRLIPAALLLKATALAAAATPELNGWWVEDEFRPAATVRLGVAVALRPSGLVTPVLDDAAALPLDDVMDRVRDMVVRARAGTLLGSQLGDPSITVTNLGDLGVDSVQGVIYPPQVALVGFGRIAERPWAADGMLGVRPVVTMTLAGDHRASDGRTGGRLLTDIAARLAHPEEL